MTITILGVVLSLVPKVYGVDLEGREVDGAGRLEALIGSRGAVWVEIGETVRRGDVKVGTVKAGMDWKW